MDSVSKQACFIATTATITVLRAAKLILTLHEHPKQVVLDYGPQFVAEFMRELYCLLGIKLAMTTAYNPQADGQTERVNQDLEPDLQVFMNQCQDD